MCLLASTLDRHAIHPVMKERVRSWTAGSWGFFWILRDWWPRKHTTAAVKPYSSTLQFLISCVREKKKKTSSPSTVKRLLPVDLSSRKVATLLLTCATVASKRSLFVFTPLVFGVAYNVIDFFCIYHLYKFFFGSSRVRFHIFLRRQRTWPFELKVRFNSPIFAMFKTSSCQESKKNRKRGTEKNWPSVVSSRIPCEPLYHLTHFPRFLTRESAFSEETRCLLLRHREEESVLGQVHHVCISQWYSLLKA